MSFKYFLQALIILWSELALAFEMKSNVKLTQVLRSDLYDAYQAIGEVKIATSRDFYAKTPGTITYITNKQGSSIKAGEVILEINGAAAHAMHEQTKSNIEAAEFSFKKDRALFDKKLISTEAFTKAKLNYETARYEHEKTMQQYYETVILAPFDGHLGAISYSIGENANAGDYLLSITNGNETEVTVSLPAKIIDLVDNSTKVELSSGKDKNITAKIIAKSPHISKNSGSFIVKIAADAKNLRHGDHVKVKFFLNQHLGLVIPESAIQKHEDGSFVFVVNSESKAEQVHVVLGTRLSGKVEILDGLKEGQKIIIEGLTSLKKDSPVQVIE